MNKTGLRLFFQFILLICLVGGVASTLLAQVTIARISDTKFVGDAVGGNPPNPVLNSAYVGYRITNSGAAISDAWAQIGSFSDPLIGLASTEDGMYHIGAMGNGATKYVFFYLTSSFGGAAASGTVSTTHTVAVYNGRPPSGSLVQSSSFSLALGPGNIVQANANKVTAGSVPAGLSLGSMFTISVTGQTGTIDSPEAWAFTPASDPSWPADSFELEDVSIALSSGNTGTYLHQLYLSSELTSSSATDYTITYTFRVTGTTAAPTAVRYISYITSGGQYKHTTVTSLSNIPPLPAVTNGLTVTKSATPAQVNVAGGSTGTSTYSLLLANSATSAGTIDQFVDTLPSSPAAVSYVAGSSKYGVCGSESSISEPQISGQQLTWTALFSVPASSSRCLTYTVTFPSTPGNYLNSATGRIGSTSIYIGTSGSTAATATVAVTVPDLTVATNSGTFTQGQTGASYSITVSNTGSGATIGQVTVTDVLPAGITPTGATGSGWSCGVAGQTVTCTRADALAAGSSYPAITLTVNVASNAAASISNTSSVSGGGDAVGSNNSSTKVTTVNPIAADLTITKTASASTLVKGSSGSFTLTVTNNSNATDSSVVTVTDSLPSGLTPVTAAGTGWSCNIAAQTVTCTRNDVLNGGSSYPDITITSNVESNAAASLTNTASVSGGGDATPATASVTVSTADGADLTLTVNASSPTFVRGAAGNFTVSATNNGGIATNGTIVTIASTLPAGLTPTSATGTGWSCNVAAQTVTCTRTDVLNAGAGYPAITIAANVASNAAASLTTSVSVSGGGDATPGSASATVNTADPVRLTIAKTASAATFVHGSTGSFNLVVTNSGGMPTDGTIVTVTDTFPAGLTPSTASGTGWSCNIAGQTTTCTRNDVLNAAASYPAITIASSVASNAGASLTNTASVSGGGDNTAATASVTIGTADGPDLNMTVISNPPILVYGSTGTVTLTVTNSGGMPTDGTPITVTSTLPAGLTPTTASGTGWTCNIAGQTVTCTRPDVLGAGSSFPPINIVATVGSGLSSPVAITGSVSGGGDATAATPSISVNTTDPTNLTMTKTANASTLARGGSGTFTLRVTNSGGIATDGTTVTVTDTLPSGLTPATASGTGWSCNVAGQVVTCTRNDVLNGTATYPAIAVTANVASNAAASLTNTASVAGGGDNTSASGSVTISTADPTDLTLTMTSSASTFIHGSSGTFTLTVTNSGGLPTDGTAVTLTDTLPTGFTPAAASGTGWSCNISGQSVTCTRSDVLNASASYPAVTITASVASNAAASVTNSASVLGGGDNTPSLASVTLNTADGTDLTMTLTAAAATLVRGSSNDFTLTISNTGGVATDGTTVTITSTLPAGLTPTAAAGTGWSCSITGQALTCTRNDVLNGGSTYPPITLTASVAANAASPITTTASVSGGGDTTPGTASVSVNTANQINLTMAMTPSAPTFVRGSSGTFNITVTNNGGLPTNASTVTVTDTLPSGLTPTGANGAGWSCSISAFTVTCTRSDVLNANASYPAIAITAGVAANASASLTNTATATGGGAATPGSASATISTADGTDLTMSLTSNAATLLSGSTGTVTATVSNSGGTATNGTVVTFTSTLPAGLTPANAAGSGWSCNIAGQTVTCTRSDVLNAGSSYPAITLTVNATATSAVSLTTTASVSGGGDSTAGTGSVSVQVAIPTPSTPNTPDLTLSFTGAGNVLPGQSGVSYTVTVSNIGTSPTAGTVAATTSLPTWLTAFSLSGQGWNCLLTTLTCTRADALPAGGSYPAINLVLNVNRNASGSLASTARVSGGGETNAANNEVTFATAVTPPPITTTPTTIRDLTILISGPGVLDSGQHGAAFTVTVSNIGNATITTPSSVSIALPDALTAAAAGGSGWTCSIAARSVTCSRSGSIPPGTSLPPISIAVDVADNATGGTLTATVSNSDDTVSENNRASASFTVTSRPFDFALTKSHTGNFTQGKTGAYALVVTNVGPGPSAGAVVVADTLPSGLRPLSASGDGWTCTVADQAMNCKRSDSLTAGTAYPSIALNVAIADTAPASIVNTADVVAVGDAHPENNHATDTATVIQLTPDLKLTQSHSGEFTRGQNGATFQLLVENIGSGSTKGDITISDATPAPFVPTAASGSGWDCVIASETVTCSRADVLAAGGSYPAITLTVSVAADAPATVTNTASVSAAGDADLSNNSAADEVKLADPVTVDMRVTHDIDRPVVSPGETVGFHIAVVNPSQIELSDVTLYDTLPPGFTYVPSSAKVQILDASGNVVSAAQAITTTVSGDTLTFNAGNLPKNSQVVIAYATLVGTNARSGQFQSNVTGTANSPLGQKVSTVPVKVKIVIMNNVFSLTQVLVGRVFEDTNKNGRFDNGEPGVANVRVVTSTGQAATTDSFGQYSLPALAAGSVLIAVDPATLPIGLELPPQDSRLDGASRLLRTPLEGGSMLRENFPLIRMAQTPAAPKPSFAEHLEGDSWGEAVKLELVVDRATMAAGGRDRQLIRVLARDKNGNAAAKTSVVLTASRGALLAGNKAVDLEACESVLTLEERPELSRQLLLDTDGGVVIACLVSDVVPGATHIAVTGSIKEDLSASSDVRFEAQARQPVLVALGEVGIGLSDPGKNATPDAQRVDGQASVFYQGSVTQKDLVTVAVRTQQGINSATGTSGMFGFDPTQRAYPVLGDASIRQELAQSTSRVYARYDRGQSYLLYGDLRGDLTTDGRNSLLEFNRNVTGIRAQVQGVEKTNWMQGQFARPKTAYTREIFTILAGSVLRLSKQQIIRGSETVTIEVHDRRNPERTISRETLVRNVDYALDNLSGVLYLTRPMSLFDRELNTIQIVTTYEYETVGLDSFIYLGRGSYSFNRLGLRLGGSLLNQEEAGAKFSVGGVEVEQRLLNGGRLKAVVPMSNGRLPLDARSRDGKAVRGEFEQPLGFRGTVLRGRFAKTDEQFFNPYGSIEVPGQTTGIASIETRPFESMRISVGVQEEKNRNDAVDNERQTVSFKLSQTLLPGLTAEGGLDRRQFDDYRDNRQLGSQLLTGGLQWKPVPRLETAFRREENIGADVDPTYPNQTLLGMQFRMTSATRVFATQRFSDAPIIPISGAETTGLFLPSSKNETAVGIETRVRRNTNFIGRYRLDSSINGTDSFAVLGVISRVPVHSGLSIDWSLDDALHLAGTSKGYVGGSIGFSQSREDKLRSSVRYELRRRDQSEHLLSAGLVGKLTDTTAALARYRVVSAATAGGNLLSDGQLALSIRPRKTDRVAMLLSYDYASARTAASSLGFAAGRTDRLSVDGLIDITHSTQFYSRLAVAKVPAVGERYNATFVQTRLQQALSQRFDIAGEARWVLDGGGRAPVFIVATEWGTWVTRDLRVGVGYSSQGFMNPGSLMNATAARGGTYLIISTRLSALFDLMN